MLNHQRAIAPHPVANLLKLLRVYGHHNYFTSLRTFAITSVVHPVSVAAALDLFSRIRRYAAQVYMSNVKYSLDKQYFSCMVNTVKRESLMIGIGIDGLLKERGRTFYWLAKATGVSHTTLWRLKKGKALGINFETLEKLCLALKCQPGDVLSLNNQKQQGTKKSLRPHQHPKSISR
jgi:putative transcriptional regulator